MLKGLKGMLFEDSGEKKDAPAAAPVQAPAATGSVAPQYVSETDSNVYENLKGATDFEKTEVGQKLQKYLAPLAGLTAVDPNTKLKMAVAQAASLDGLTTDQILGAFPAMKEALQKEAATFESELALFVQEQVEAPGVKAKELAEKISQLQVEQRAAVDQSTANGAKAMALKTEFSMALQRRTTELDQELVRISTILKG